MISNVILAHIAFVVATATTDPIISSVNIEPVSGDDLSRPVLLAAKGDCTKACEGGYLKCVKRYGSDLKKCAEKRRVCVSQCGK